MSFIPVLAKLNLQQSLFQSSMFLYKIILILYLKSVSTAESVYLRVLFRQFFNFMPHFFPFLKFVLLSREEQEKKQQSLGYVKENNSYGYVETYGCHKLSSTKPTCLVILLREQRQSLGLKIQRTAYLDIISGHVRCPKCCLSLCSSLGFETVNDNC